RRLPPEDQPALRGRRPPGWWLAVSDLPRRALLQGQEPLQDARRTRLPSPDRPRRPRPQLLPASPAWRDLRRGGRVAPGPRGSREDPHRPHRQAGPVEAGRLREGVQVALPPERGRAEARPGGNLPRPSPDRGPEAERPRRRRDARRAHG